MRRGPTVLGADGQFVRHYPTTHRIWIPVYWLARACVDDGYAVVGVGVRFPIVHPARDACQRPIRTVTVGPSSPGLLRVGRPQVPYMRTRCMTTGMVRSIAEPLRCSRGACEYAGVCRDAYGGVGR